ncbi:riboflavin synthase [Nocardioides antri]|uniref:Riboflavin synthase n=1 Tax=Nocardioides antri TaxID=2607659 RepID=A0A5B1LVK8_9ACTN|nr:riboflavin synthase [Nocardioides antri]KAA1424178.1 riboflavin synthase [Nocardioides antri]
MFTGIVEELGTVAALEEQSDAVRLTVEGALATTGAQLGDSISVNGCCLTVAELDRLGDGTFTADVMRMTLDKTSLGALAVGHRVNLERACTPQTRLGGHIVQGHVDTTATILDRTPGEHWELVEVALPEQIRRYVVLHGSITVDGISLTVAELKDESFVVSLIPETLARTTLGFKRPGDPVNLEADIIAKHVERLIQK